MLRMFENRDSILNESISNDGYRNKSIRCRQKMSPAKLAFEKRLGEVMIIFSAVANIGRAIVKDLAKERLGCLQKNIRHKICHI